MKKTPWFPCTTPPVRQGWYECSHGGVCNGNPIMLRYRNGYWYIAKSNEMSDFGNSLLYKDHDLWRGILK